MFSNSIDFGKIFLGKDNLQCTQILAKVLLLLGSRNGDEIIPLSQDPSEAELTGGASFLVRDFSANKSSERHAMDRCNRCTDLLDRIDQLEILSCITRPHDRRRYQMAILRTSLNASPWNLGSVRRQSSLSKSSGLLYAPVKKPGTSSVRDCPCSQEWPHRAQVGCTQRLRCRVRDKCQGYRWFGCRESTERTRSAGH